MKKLLEQISMTTILLKSVQYYLPPTQKDEKAKRRQLNRHS